MTHTEQSTQGTAPVEVNHFPGDTWHFLSISGTQLQLPSRFDRTQAGDDVPAALRDSVRAIQTGMGEAFDAAFDELVAKSGGKAVFMESAAGLCVKTLGKLEITASADEAVAADIVIRARKNSDSSFVLALKSDEGTSTIGCRVRVLAQENARVHVAVVNLAGEGTKLFASLGALAESGATVEVSEVELGGQAVHTGTRVDLAGSKSRFEGRAFCLVQGGSTLDINQTAVQRGAMSESRFSVEQVLFEGASKSWRGTIDFRRGCAGAVGDEQEDVLLFGERVINKSLPVILCDEEAVEGRHGCSIGKVDAGALFYMGSRGLDEATAKKLIVTGRAARTARYIGDEALEGEIKARIDTLL